MTPAPVTPQASLDRHPFVRTRIPLEVGRATIVFQNGRPVAEVFCDEADPQVEHWVLFPSYVEPSTASHVVTTWIAGAKLYRGGTAEFFKRVPFERGSHYLEVDANAASKWSR